MECTQARNVLHGYLDGELDQETARACELHVASCPDCALERDRQLALQRTLRQVIPRQAPPALRQRIVAELDAVVTSSAKRVAWPQLGLWVSLAAVLLVTWFAARLWYAPSASAALEQEVVAAHVRSLLPGHLTDVASSDHHTVKPWFTGRIEFAPWVEDLAAQGFPLIGGRLEVMSGTRVAALVYQRRQHTINLFERPAGSEAPAMKTTSREGYHILAWSQDGRYFVAISDIAMAELVELQGAVRQAQ